MSLHIASLRGGGGGGRWREGNTERNRSSMRTTCESQMEPCRDSKKHAIELCVTVCLKGMGEGLVWQSHLALQPPGARGSHCSLDGRHAAVLLREVPALRKAAKAEAQEAGQKGFNGAPKSSSGPLLRTRAAARGGDGPVRG